MKTENIEHIPGIEAYTGEKLVIEIEFAKTLARRNCYLQLRSYLNNPTRHILLITGLRRTGKTILAKQGVAHLEKKFLDQTVFLSVSENRSIHSSELYELAEEYYDAGFRYFFIDEATSTKDFPAGSKDLADHIAERGCHVILSGTHSLSMEFAKQEYLEGRYEEIKTTKIPFHEWHRLLSKKENNLSLNTYIKYGGILDYNLNQIQTAVISEKNFSFKNKTNIEYYIYSSISLNIQNSLAKNAAGKEFGILRPLWEEGILTNAIANIIQQQNHSIALDIVNSAFQCIDTHYAIKAFSDKPNIKRIILKNRKIINREITERLYLDNETPRITKNEARTILKYLKKIDVFSDATIYIMPSIDPKKRKNLALYREESRILQTQIGIRQGQISAALACIWDILRIHKANITYKEFEYHATSMAHGLLLEDVIFLDIQGILPENFKVAKITWEENEAEFDIAIINSKDIDKQKVSLFEIKHTSTFRTNTLKHLRNQLALAQIEETFGQITSRTLLYMGKTIVKDILILNATEFLLRLGTQGAAALFPQLLPEFLEQKKV